MNKLAYATLFVLSAGVASMLLATPTDAKGSGGGHGGAGHGISARGSFRPMLRPNIGPLARRGHPIPRNIGPLAGRHYAHHRHHHHGRHHHHRGGNDFAYGYGYSDYAYSTYPYTADQFDDVADEAPPPPPRIAHPVIRTVENSKDVCAADHVKVPASGGGDTSVTILRCY
jgi:hypothetical protein